RVDPAGGHDLAGVAELVALAAGEPGVGLPPRERVVVPHVRPRRAQGARRHRAATGHLNGGADEQEREQKERVSWIVRSSTLCRRTPAPTTWSRCSTGSTTRGASSSTRWRSS